MCRLMGSGENIYQEMELWFGQKERKTNEVCVRNGWVGIECRYVLD